MTLLQRNNKSGRWISQNRLYSGCKLVEKEFTSTLQLLILTTHQLQKYLKSPGLLMRLLLKSSGKKSSNKKLLIRHHQGYEIADVGINVLISYWAGKCLYKRPGMKKETSSRYISVQKSWNLMLLLKKNSYSRTFLRSSPSHLWKQLKFYHEKNGLIILLITIVFQLSAQDVTKEKQNEKQIAAVTDTNENTKVVVGKRPYQCWGQKRRCQSENWKQGLNILESLEGPKVALKNILETIIHMNLMIMTRTTRGQKKISFQRALVRNWVRI